MTNKNTSSSLETKMGEFLALFVGGFEKWQGLQLWETNPGRMVDATEDYSLDLVVVIALDERPLLAS